MACRSRSSQLARVKTLSRSCYRLRQDTTANRQQGQRHPRRPLVPDYGHFHPLAQCRWPNLPIVRTMNIAAAATTSMNFPGWYPSPVNASSESFWNGRDWTGLTRDAPVEDEMAALLGPIDPTLQALLTSFDSNHSTEARAFSHEATMNSPATA